ncbi:MAG: hypothetical protein ACRDE2_11665, partial [Chitinophagaceae bacterium]
CLHYLMSMVVLIPAQLKLHRSPIKFYKHGKNKAVMARPAIIYCGHIIHWDILDSVRSHIADKINRIRYRFLVAYSTAG